MTGGVIRFRHLIQAFQPGQCGRIVFGAFEDDANKAAHIVAQLFRADVNPCARNDPGLLHFLDANVNGSRANAKLFGQFGVGGAGISH
ncbi:Uncharacterised protein [Salmonella enterica subsp. enterica serovar Bovismorbificans]|uniref:Uncharacterized protein n=1 Tax=Salmonella enterica subsp. enterica serovar Bovismorbificans TaxID=58097 RepID=A0A655CWE4_SALET|nr:Uncharacterised protein [Salmonella enterica subsp. enterica serovar Bovismorbificans]